MTAEDKKKYLNLYVSATRTINRCLTYIEEVDSIEKSFVLGRCSEDEERLIKTFKKSIIDRIQEQKKICLLVEQSINNLPESKYREVLQYRYIDGKTWDEIADKMMYSLGNTHKVHNKALEVFE